MTTRQEQDQNLLADTKELHRATNTMESDFFKSVCKNFERYGLLSDGQRDAVNRIRLTLEKRASPDKFYKKAKEQARITPAVLNRIMAQATDVGIRNELEREGY